MASAIFGILDYVIFGVTLGVSTIIGIYFGCFGSKQKSAKEYLYGAGNMKPFPVGLSLYSGALSATAIIGTPAEVYNFGTQFLTNAFGGVLSLLITWNLVLPVFCGNIKIKTPYEYFELRFNSKVRTMISVIYIIHTWLYMPVVLYCSTVGFSEATGINLNVCTVLIGGICVFYTMLGGFSSVIWTDALQATIMLGSCIFVMFKAIGDVGGISEMWYWADQGKRIQFFNVNPNPFERITLWSSLLGMMVIISAHSGCAASSIQRYMSLKNEQQARISTLVSVIGMGVIYLICGVIGMCMYVYYQNCDPLQSKQVEKATQLLPYFLNDIIGHIPGFQGYFIAGLICAGLSTLSAELNTVSGLIYHDFIIKWFPVNEKRGALIMKIIVLINGIYYISVSPLASKSKYIFELALSMGGITYGAKTGITLLGTTFPRSNARGAACGVIAGMLIVGWISIGAIYYDVSSSYVLPTSVANCTDLYNTTIASSALITPVAVEPLFIYKVSFMYYSVIGLIVTISVAMFVSYLTGLNDVNKMDQRLIISFMRTSEQKSLEDCKCIEQKT